MPLSPFDDREVIASGVEMPGASGGLNKALAVDELEMHHGDRVVIAVECEVVKVRFDQVKDTPALQRVHVMRVDNAAVLEADLVEEILEKQRIRVEEAQGVKRLDFADPDDADDPGDGAES